jgi:hypothetical protein
VHHEHNSSNMNQDEKCFEQKSQRKMEYMYHAQYIFSIHLMISKIITQKGVQAPELLCSVNISQVVTCLHILKNKDLNLAHIY